MRSAPSPPEWRTLALYSPPHFLSYLQTSETQRCPGRSCFSIKSKYQNTSAFDFSSSKLTFGIENVTLSRIPLRYYLDSVTVILTAPCLQMYVMSRAVRKQVVTHCRRLVEFSVSKWLKLTQFHLFTPLFGWKKQLCNGKTHKKYEKRAFRL